MGDITLSAGVRANLLNLQQTASLLDKTQNRLATGKKVNSALDNPINFFTASSLSARAGDLTTLLDGIGNAVQTLQAASNGLASLTKLVENAKALGQSALQSAQSTAKYTGTVAGLTSGSNFTVTATKTLTVSDGTTTSTFTFAGTSADTAQSIIDAINNTASQTIKAELTSDGRISLQARGATTIVVGGTASGAELAQYGFVAGTTAAGTLNTSRSSLASQYDSLRTQIDQLAKDSGFNGVNLLNGDGLKVTFNEKNTSSLSITGVTYSATGLGVSASAGTWQTDYDINASIAALSTALTTMRTQASTFGANLSIVQTRQDFTKSTINTLQVGADNLTLADSNEEGANLLALQTRQQLSTTALSLASQANQNVLRLLQG